MQVAVEPFNFLLLPANIQYFSVLINGQLPKGCRFDALRDLCDTRLALLCLICKVSDVFVLSKQESAIKRRFLYPQYFRSKSV